MRMGSDGIGDSPHEVVEEVALADTLAVEMAMVERYEVERVARRSGPSPDEQSQERVRAAL